MGAKGIFSHISTPNRHLLSIGLGRWLKSHAGRLELKMSQPTEKPVKQKKSLLRNPFFWGAIVGMAILPVLRMLAMARRDAPAPLVEVETWQMRDSQNRLVSQESLNGKIVIFNLYYNSQSAFSS